MLRQEIIAYRGIHKLSQVEFAKLCDVNVKTIIKIENGGDVRLTTEIRIREVLK